MRTIDSIIIHCSATPCGKDFTAADIDRWHRQRSFNGIGYHFVIRLDGAIENGRPISKPGAHCIGWNNRSIGICYIGGLNACGRPADTRTPAQKKAMKELVKRLQNEHFGIRTIIGHRDTSPDLNNNGQIELQEFIKSCPCFDVRTWLKSVSLAGFCLGLCMLSTACSSHKSSSRWAEKADSSMTSQTLRMAEQKQHMHASVKQSSDSSAMNQHIIEEYVEQTTIIRRKKQSELSSGKNHKEAKADTLAGNEKQADERMDTAYHASQEHKQSEKKKTGYTSLWLIGGGAAGSILLYRRFRQTRRKDDGQDNRTECLN